MLRWMRFPDIGILVGTLCIVFFAEAALQSSAAGFLPAKLVPRIHLVAVGIDKYSDPKLPALEFARSDAELIVNTFRKLPPRAELGRIEFLADQQATRDAILAALKSVAADADPNDTVVIYWAAISTMNVRQQRVVFLPADAAYSAEAGSSDVPDTSILEIEDILRSFDRNQRIVFLGDGCNIGEGVYGELAQAFPRLAVLSASKADQEATEDPILEHSAFAYYLAELLTTPIDDFDQDGLISVDEVFVQLYPRMVKYLANRLVHHPAAYSRAGHKIFLAQAIPRHKALEFEGAVPELRAGAPVRVNGVEMKDSNFDSHGKVLRLSDQDSTAIRNGINVIEEAKGELKRGFVFWNESGKLRRFETPYQRSHAIIAAVDDYDRSRVPGARPSGLKQLTKMRERAMELGALLKSHGFETVHYLFDEDATSESIEALLKTYWSGGPNADVDRLVFYFGGHGVTAGQRSLLATWDYDPQRRAQTTLHSFDLVSKHSEYLVPRHALFLLDVCHSGLAFATRLSAEDRRGPVPDLTDKQFDKLARIRLETREKARNILVAGTGTEEAVWINGGVFTQVLIEALQGGGDENSDGLLEFEEYARWIKHEVNNRTARAEGIEQRPSYDTMRHFGDGRVMFLTPGSVPRPTGEPSPASLSAGTR